MIYICIPAHNEEQTVGVVLWKIRQVMAEFPRDYQLLVVDDASTDKTPEVLAPYARVLPLTVVRTEQRVGESAAVEMMLREAVRRSEYPKRDVIITLQADFTQEPDELVGLIKRTEAGADIVVGQTRPDPAAPRAQRWARALARRVLGHGRMPEGVTDPFTGYRAYRVFAVKRALEDRGGRLVHWNGWAGAAELLIATAPHARRIETVELVERRERLQRASRLLPWPALRAVWSLAREVKPLQVASPAELDQAMTAVVASRTSEVAAAMAGGGRGARPQRNERGRGSTEGRPRSENRRDGEGRRRGGERTGAGERPERERRPRGERPASGQRPQRPERPPRPEKPARERPPRPPREERPAAGVPAAPAPDEQLEVLLGLGGEGQAEGGAGKAKRKRPRRRKRSGNKAQGSEGQAPAEPGTPTEELAFALEALLDRKESDEGTGEGEAGPGGEDGKTTRRRRRGRRGGRRRRGAAGEAGAAPEAESYEGGNGNGEPAAPHQGFEPRPEPQEPRPEPQEPRPEPRPEPVPMVQQQVQTEGEKGHEA